MSSFRLALQAVLVTIMTTLALGHKLANHPVNHIGISVPDTDAAVKFYTSVFGFAVTQNSSIVDRAEDPDSIVFEIYPPDLNKVKITWLTTVNGVGLEVFEFMDPKIERGNEACFERDYKRGGFFHMALTVPSVPEALARGKKAGARQIGPTVPVFEFEAAYMADPWGNVVEVCDGTFDMMNANRASAVV